MYEVRRNRKISEIQSPDWKLVEEYFYHINERHRITIKRWNGEPPPWTQDKILREWFFTSVKREFDKTTIFLKENFYDKYMHRDAEEILLNCGIFRYFGNIDYITQIGWQTKWDPKFLIDTAKERKAKGLKNFTGAFVITNNGIAKPKEEVVVGYFLVDYARNIPMLLENINKRRSWQDAIESLNTVHGFANFMSKEVIQDAMMTNVLSNAIDKYTWSPAGPGAKIGIHMMWHLGEVGYDKVRNSKGDYMPYMKFLYDIREEYLEEHTKKLDWTVHDIQWSLCEFSKRRNIKQKGRGKRKYRFSSN